MTDIDLFAPATLTRSELFRFNKAAHQRGEHMCTKCYAVLPYTEDYFFKSSKRRHDGTVILMPPCKRCFMVKTAAGNKARYAVNEVYREQRKANARAYWNSLSPAAKRAHHKKRVKRAQARAQEAQYE